jgi:transaldolase
MKFFVDTADVKEIRECQEMGLVDGVTTNPSLIAKSGRDFRRHWPFNKGADFLDHFFHVAALDYDGMMREANVLRKVAKNVAVKVPLTVDGLRACKSLSSEGTMVNVTLCFSANQALLAAKAGATFISPFIGRLDDINLDGMELIRDIRVIYDTYDFDTNILAASIRSANHIKDAALTGADYATAPPAVLKGLIKHPLTDKGIESFLADWAKAGGKI